jgi:tRNA pseudouridine(38-40) synthase
MSLHDEDAAASNKLKSTGNESNDVNTPYQESYPDEQLRLFWQAEPFSIVEALMDKIMAMDPAHPEKLLELQRASSSNPTGSDNSQSCHIFHNFYNGKLMDENDDSANADDDNDCDDEQHLNMSTPGTSAVPTSRSGKHNFRLDLAYKGSDFCGWQRKGKKIVVKDTPLSSAAADTTPSPPPLSPSNIGKSLTALPSVQEIVEAALDNRDVRIAGRTDAGVHAFGQVARVRLETHVSLQQVQEQLTRASSCLSSSSSLTPSCAWKCWRVVAVDTKFHPSFGAKSRSYVYILDGHVLQAFLGNVSLLKIVHDLNEMLQPLQGEALDYYAFSYGKLHTQSSICTLYHARVRVAHANDSTTTSDGHGNAALIVELTGDRFLRRMVRKLVATILWLLLPTQLSAERENKTSRGVANNTESIADGSTINRGDALMKIVQSKDRRGTAKAAPPNGLILVGAEMSNRHDC